MKKYLIILFLISSFIKVALANDKEQLPKQVNETQLKAAFIGKLVTFIEWPKKIFSDGVFIIGIYGKSQIGTSLEKILKDKKLKNIPVKIVQIQNLSNIDIYNIVFIAKGEKENIHLVVNLTEKKPILTIGDSDGFGKKGVLINFFIQDDKIRFEINECAVRKSGLKFSSNLLELARIIECN